MIESIRRCPFCNGALEPVKLRCRSCETTVEGRLPFSRLALLTSEQQQFVEAFLVARGNIADFLLSVFISVNRRPAPLE